MQPSLSKPRAQVPPKPKSKSKMKKDFLKEFDKMTIETKPSLSRFQEKTNSKNKKKRVFTLSQKGVKTVAFEGRPSWGAGDMAHMESIVLSI